MKNLFVGHDRFETATEVVSRFHLPVKDGLPDTGSLFVLAGDPRTGKSYALKRYARGFPADLTGSEGSCGGWRMSTCRSAATRPAS